LSRRAARQRADELLERFLLTQAATRLAREYSGGMRRRLDLAASLVNPPTVLFLDEPTTGLDPPSREELWGVVRELRRAGTTIVLTTQYLEEADRLADHITVIDHGRAVAKGTAAALKAEVGGDIIEIYASDPDLAERAAHLLAGKVGIGADAVTIDPHDRHALVSVESGCISAIDAIRLLDGENLRVDDLKLRQASLDEVFSMFTKRR
jgi:ABC-2 type transport system ATP-binding protein